MASEKREKKDKSAKKEKRDKVGDDGVKKSSSKKDKKEKRKSKGGDESLLDTLEHAVESAASAVLPAALTGGADSDDEGAMDVDAGKIVGALVPFANPLADEKQTKKLLKGVKKAAKNKTLKRGVKEVVKSVRKSPINGPSSSNTADPPGIIIIAADISPMDVISHIPVLCEDHNIPYIYVTSRAELGAAGNTKRATSVVMLAKERQGKGKETAEVDEEYKEAYAELVKLVQKASKNVRI